MNFFSKAGQDQFLFENFFRGKRNGVFVDAGEHTAETVSNTLFFERFMDWRGHRFELSRQDFGKLGLLLQKRSLFQIDYCSIDAQGAELGALAEIDFSRFNISLFTIRTQDEAGKLSLLMADRGYDLIAKMDQDCVFKRRDVKRLARTSVVCAVWHGDADRHRLIEGHAENLRRQSVPVEPVYVFDGRDEPPKSIPGRKVVAHEKLSIYQAWNVGLAMVDTPFVMNLNLDDRLAPDAVELLENTLMRENAALVGGEWKICYSQQETDAVEPCFPAAQLPFVSEWPPIRGTRTRLGSGGGERGTLGPATMWRMDTHIGVPRYPWRFPDGTVIKVIGDSCWWTLVTQHLKKKAVRIADVIGNYHSHPNEQAEFRGPSNEAALMNALGVSLF